MITEIDQIKTVGVAHSGVVRLRQINDHRDGTLCIMNGMQEIPFEIKRMYYITQLNAESSIRGLHAHRKLEQVIFCLHGSFVLTLDDGRNKQAIHMNRSNLGITLGAGLWHAMEHFSADCVILVAASDYYCEADYIRNYEEFIRYIKEQ